MSDRRRSPRHKSTAFIILTLSFSLFSSQTIESYLQFIIETYTLVCNRLHYYQLILRHFLLSLSLFLVLRYNLFIMFGQGSWWKREKTTGKGNKDGGKGREEKKRERRWWEGKGEKEKGKRKEKVRDVRIILFLR